MLTQAMNQKLLKATYITFKTGEQIFIDLSDTLDEPLTNRELEVLQFDEARLVK